MRSTANPCKTTHTHSTRGFSFIRLFSSTSPLSIARSNWFYWNDYFVQYWKKSLIYFYCNWYTQEICVYARRYGAVWRDGERERACESGNRNRFHAFDVYTLHNIIAIHHDEHRAHGFGYVSNGAECWSVVAVAVAVVVVVNVFLLCYIFASFVLFCFLSLHFISFCCCDYLNVGSDIGCNKVPCAK